MPKKGEAVSQSRASRAKALGIHVGTLRNREIGVPTRAEYYAEKRQAALERARRELDEAERSGGSFLRAQKKSKRMNITGVAVVSGREMTEETRASIAAYREIQAEGGVLNYNTIAERTGLSDQPARRAMDICETEDRKDAEYREVFSASVQQRYERAVAKAEAEIASRLRLEIAHEMNDLWNERVIRHYAEKVDKADAILASHKGTIARPVWRKLLAFIHPDVHRDDLMKSKADELFRLIQPLESVLVISPPPLTRSQREGVAPIPSTMQEMMARMAFYQEKARAARAAKKAKA